MSNQENQEAKELNPKRLQKVHFVSTCTAQQRDEIQEALSIAMQARLSAAP